MPYDMRHHQLNDFYAQVQKLRSQAPAIKDGWYDNVTFFVTGRAHDLATFSPVEV